MMQASGHGPAFGVGTAACRLGPPIVLIVLIGMPVPALAHAASEHHWWTFDPWILVPLAITTLLYGRGIVMLAGKRRSIRVVQPRAVAGYIGGLAALFLALVWPLDALGELSFAAHMAQHMILIAVAAPLFALAEPSVPVSVAVSSWGPGCSKAIKWVRTHTRFLLRPRLAFAIHGVTIWLWHAPLLFEEALRQDWLHIIEHITFFVSGLIFWASLRQLGRAGGEGYGAAALWTLGTLMHTGLLGALITFAPHLLYDTYASGEHGWLTPLEDQQLAGLIMWIPAGAFYLIAGLVFAAAWLHSADRHAQARHPAAGTE